jgi:hypothetical protein
MSNFERNIISVNEYFPLEESEEVSFEEFKGMLDDFVSNAPEGATDFFITVEEEYDFEYHTTCLFIKYNRPETDDEMEKRLKKEKEADQRKADRRREEEEEELRELARLKEKYEGKL